MENVCLPSGKKLKDLKVVALQKELGKRRLSKVGKKVELIERLARVLNAEILDDEETEELAEQSKETIIITNDVEEVENSRKLHEDEQMVDDEPKAKSENENENENDEPKVNYVDEASFLSNDSVVEISPIVSKTPIRKLSVSAKKKRKSSTPRSTAPTPKTPLVSKSKLGSEKRKTKTPPSVREEVDTMEESEFLSDDGKSPSSSLSPVSSDDFVPVAVEETKRVQITEPVLETVELKGLLKKKMRKQSRTPLLGSIKVCTPASEKRKSINKSINTNKTPDRRASKKLTNSSVLGLSSASKAIKKGSKGPARFTQQHAKEFEKMETIADYKDKIKARHDDMTAQVPDFVKRLATPKSAKVVRSRLPNVERNSKTVEKQPKNALSNVDPLKKIDLNTFKFGNVPAKDIKSVQNKTSVKFTAKSNSVHTNQERGGNKPDVKQLTKALQLTIPIQNRRLEFLSTPKSLKSNSKQSRVGYTPRKGAVKFVDTSKLSDEEFAIAVKGGLIPKSSRVVAEYNRAIKTDQLLDIKRKLKLN
ncbi:unnamed protein product [Auanema sp. JU1783]|nr:unnamed protein product [Auanema sp. JU1783]